MIGYCWLVATTHELTRSFPGLLYRTKVKSYNHPSIARPSEHCTHIRKLLFYCCWCSNAQRGRALNCKHGISVRSYGSSSCPLAAPTGLHLPRVYSHFLLIGWKESWPTFARTQKMRYPCPQQKGELDERMLPCRGCHGRELEGRCIHTWYQVRQHQRNIFDIGGLGCPAAVYQVGMVPRGFSPDFVTAKGQSTPRSSTGVRICAFSYMLAFCVPHGVE